MPIADISPSAPAAHETSTGLLLLCLPSLATGALDTMRHRIAAALPGQSVRLATPEAASENDSDGDIHLVAYPTPAATATAQDAWALTAADYLAATELTRRHGASATLVLGAEAASLSTTALQSLAAPVLAGSADLALPRYATGPHDALLSSALLYPLTYALFGIEAHLPLPLDAAFSPRMAARLSVLAHRPSPAGSDSAPLLWPVAEAATAAFAVREVRAGERTLPHPGDSELHARLAQVAGSLFADVDTRATFWQRARPTAAPTPRSAPARSTPAASDDPDAAGVPALAEDFRNAFLDLQEIWSLVLPPRSLLALKKVSRSPAEGFELPSGLWARIVYDFVLAWHLRTINRGHLLGAFTPLYLAWVASHLQRSAGDAALAAHHIEQTADAFITEKPYIVARWRWPDRFNP